MDTINSGSNTPEEKTECIERKVLTCVLLGCSDAFTCLKKPYNYNRFENNYSILVLICFIEFYIYNILHFKHL